MPDFHNGGVSLHFETAGSPDGPPTLLVHGFCSNFQVNWVGSRWVDTLSRAGRRIIGLENRGHGQSDKPHDPSAYGLRMVDDVVGLLDHLELDEVDYIGYSMGSQIGLRLLVSNPERVRRAVLAGVGSNIIRPWNHGEQVARRLRGDLREESPAAVMFHRFALAVPNNDLEALAACIAAPSRAMTKEELASIRVPVLLAVGGDDPIAGNARELAGLIPGAQFFEVPGRDHATAVPSRAIKEKALEFLDQTD